MRTAHLSAAVEYYNSSVSDNHMIFHLHMIFDTDAYHVVAIQNAAVQDSLPADVAVDARLARLGVAMLYAADNELIHLLHEAGIFFLTPTNHNAVSVSSFSAVFENIAYVILRLLPPRWEILSKPVCTCHVYGIQQQCQHTLFVEAFLVDSVACPRDFSVVVNTRKPGRPKGKAKAVAKRKHN